jgi:hypothetical protein
LPKNSSKAMHGRQVLVAVAEVVLAELTGGVAESFEKLRDRWVLKTQAERGSRRADLRKTGADRRLTGNERCASRGTALLPVKVGEHRAFPGNPVDVRGSVPHDTVIVGADIEPADVVGHEPPNGEI